MGDQNQGGSIRSSQTKSLADFLLTPEVEARESSVSLPIDHTDSFNAAPVNPVLGQLFKATVVQNSNELSVNFGDKRDGQVSDWEFRAYNDAILSSLQPGTKITVMALRHQLTHDEFWPVSLLFATPEVFASKMRPISVRVEEVNCQKKFDENGNFVEAIGKGVNVRVGPFKAYIPISELSAFANQRLDGAELIEALEELVGKHLEVCVTACSVSGTRLSIICSQKEASWRGLLSELRIGTILTGTVARFTRNNGTLVDLGNGINGYIHIRELTLDRIQHPSDVVSPGEEVRVQVLDYDRVVEDGRIRYRVSLSRKVLLASPWDDMNSIPSEGTKVTGVVNNIPLEGYGCFVRVEGHEGLSGLVHISELARLSPTELTHPRQVVEVGKKLQLVVDRVDTHRRRMSFGVVVPKPIPLIEALGLKVDKPRVSLADALGLQAEKPVVSLADALGLKTEEPSVSLVEALFGGKERKKVSLGEVLGL